MAFAKVSYRSIIFLLLTNNIVKQLFLKVCMAMLCAFSSLKLYACEQSLIRATIISTEYLTTSTTIDVVVMLRFEGKASLNLAPVLQMAGEWSISCTNFTEGMYVAGDSFRLCRC